jgi:hypothetical protein
MFSRSRGGENKENKKRPAAGPRLHGPTWPCRRTVRKNQMASAIVFLACGRKTAGRGFTGGGRGRVWASAGWWWVEAAQARLEPPSLPAVVPPEVSFLAGLPGSSSTVAAPDGPGWRADAH